MPAATEAPPLTCPDGSAAPSGSIVTVAGGGTQRAAAGVLATQALLKAVGVTVAPDGSLLLSVSSSPTIWQVGADGRLTTLLDASDHAAVGPVGLAFDAAGDLFIADTLGSHVWKRDPSGVATLVAGRGTNGSAGNDGPALEAGLENPTTIGVGPDGSVYFDDHNNFRRVDPEGTIHAFAGSLLPGYEGDGGPAVDAKLGQGVLGVGSDAAGNVYLGDPGNHRVRKVDTQGVISTFAGDGSRGNTGDSGPATAAGLISPVAIAVDEDGAVFVADDIAESVRRIGPDGVITTIAGTGVPNVAATSEGDCGPATEATLSSPSGLAVRDGRVYIAERDGRIRAIVP
jgi:glucose/arabinose dehydrogenase